MYVVFDATCQKSSHNASTGISHAFFENRRKYICSTSLSSIYELYLTSIILKMFNDMFRKKPGCYYEKNIHIGNKDLKKKIEKNSDSFIVL